MEGRDLSKQGGRPAGFAQLVGGDGEAKTEFGATFGQLEKPLVSDQGPAVLTPFQRDLGFAREVCGLVIQRIYGDRAGQ